MASAVRSGVKVRTPLLQALEEYVSSDVVRFHMPGHKGGRMVWPPFRKALGRKVFAFDVTGIPGLDDLHQPSGVLMESQRQLAEACGAEVSFYSVHGTSLGVQALLLASASPGERVLLPRNVHKSIISGVILGGLEPVFLAPEWEPEFGIYLGLHPHRVEEFLSREGGVRALLVVSPTYHGVAADLPALAARAHARDLPFLVDEAHGAHFSFHPAFPLPAVAAGADGVAQGFHKVLGSLTQASVLHLRGPRLDRARVKSVLSLLQSTSPSYLLLASLEAARVHMEERGKRLWARALRLARYLRAEVASLGFKVLEELPDPGLSLDPTRVTVKVLDFGLSGLEAELFLRRRGVQVEMGDLTSIVLIVGPGNTPGDGERLLQALGELRSAGGEKRSFLARVAEEMRIPPPLPPLEELPRRAFFGKRETVAFEAAGGRVAAEMVACYPPGIPVVCPGERVTEEVRDHLLLAREAGFRFSGCRHPRLETLEVLK